MKKFLISFLLGISLNATAGCLNAKDNWGGARQHILGSAAIGLGVATVFPDTPLWGQFAISMIPGVLKEIGDCDEYGLFSRKDLISDAIGVSLGLGVNRLIISASKKTTTVAVLIPLN